MVCFIGIFASPFWKRSYVDRVCIWWTFVTQAAQMAEVREGFLHNLRTSFQVLCGTTETMRYLVGWWTGHCGNPKQELVQSKDLCTVHSAESWLDFTALHASRFNRLVLNNATRIYFLVNSFSLRFRHKSVNLKLHVGDEYEPNTACSFAWWMRTRVCSVKCHWRPGQEKRKMVKQMSILGSQSHFHALGVGASLMHQVHSPLGLDHYLLQCRQDLPHHFRNQTGLYGCYYL